MFTPATHSYVLLLGVNGGAELACNIASSGVGTMGAQERGFKLENRAVVFLYALYFFDQTLWLTACFVQLLYIRGRHLFLWKAKRHQRWLDKDKVGMSETVTVARHCQ